MVDITKRRRPSVNVGSWWYLPLLLALVLGFFVLLVVADDHQYQSTTEPGHADTLKATR